MKCYCYETNSEFIFCVENLENAQLEDVIKNIGWEKNDERYQMPYPQHMFSDARDKELINSNFTQLGQALFESVLSGFDWKRPLKLLAQKFDENGIEWYIVGSVSDAVRGIKVKPKDLDIVIHTRDYHKAKDICYSNFPESIIAPLTDNKGLFALQYMGRLFLAGGLIEIASDEKWNLEHRQPKYEKISWNGLDVYVDDLQLRYKTEIARNRKDRIKAIEEYMNRH